MDANANPNDAQDAADSDAGGPPISLFCGDKIRDPVTEECDDGPGDELDSCTSDCRVRDVLVTSPTLGDAGPRFSRGLGAGRHVVSGSREGFAVVYTTAEAASAVWLQAYDLHGGKIGSEVPASAGGSPIGAPDPTVAALPNGRFAVAWTDSASGTPDVAIRSTSAGDIPSGTPILAHDDPAGFQGDADLLWTGSRLIAAWTDDFDVVWRSFDENLVPDDAEQPLASTAAFESNVTLAAAGADWAAAWRAGDRGLETVHVRSGAVEWFTQEEPPGSEGDHPALAMIDTNKLLLVYTVGEYTDGSATSVARLRGVVLDRASPGGVVGTPLAMLSAPASTRLLGQRRPSVARVGDHFYLAWEMENPSSVPLLSDAWLQEVAPSQDGAVTVLAEWSLMDARAPAGHQGNPSLGVSSTIPGSALVMLWEDYGGDRSHGPDTDIVARFRPVPFVNIPNSKGDAGLTAGSI